MNLFKYLETSHGLAEEGNPEQADCIVCLAFGRNDIPDNKLGAIGFLIKNGTDQVMIKRLKSYNFNPGLPNIQLAKQVMELMKKYSLSAVVQWEIALAMDGEFYEEHQDQIFIVWPPKICKKGFNSKQVLEATIMIMDNHDFNVPILVAHKLHIKRVVALWGAMVEEKPIIVNQKVFCFDSNSIQKWTRSKQAWKRKEFLVRIHHLLLGWV